MGVRGGAARPSGRAAVAAAKGSTGSVVLTGRWKGAGPGPGRAAWLAGRGEVSSQAAAGLYGGGGLRLRGGLY